MSFPEDTTVNINWDLVPIITCCDLPIIGTERRHVRVQSVELILDFETKYDSHLNERREKEKTVRTISGDFHNEFVIPNFKMILKFPHESYHSFLFICIGGYICSLLGWHCVL